MNILIPNQPSAFVERYGIIVHEEVYTGWRAYPLHWDIFTIRTYEKPRKTIQSAESARGIVLAAKKTPTRAPRPRCCWLCSKLSLG